MPTPSICPPHHSFEDEPNNILNNNNDSNNNNNLFSSQPDPNNLPPNPTMALAEAIHGLAQLNRQDPNADTSSTCTKVQEPNTFDRTDPHKLQAFLVQCKLNFQDYPCVFQTDKAKVTFIQSHLKDWMDDYWEFILELQTNFGPHDPVGDAEHWLHHLSMKDRQHINKYVVEFNHLASQEFNLKIDLEEGASPPLKNIYPISATELKSLQEFIGKHLSYSFIRLSSSVHGAPVLFVCKEDGSLHLCIEF
ncbi:hypothetical protein PAXRUDRAFT_14459 [Paxillus rubicundulus Ve08.2h10]|uniref:Retrotransposon gag domain-containing protein n=1 Tax=Paxillus rubicundulus Ve08.2h10 TaxID=930991 RepID=A0A0D0DWV2_9AGAM|nr:hypothetical protein PAXRUDRAFT_14459 [Paxillus rubicundulus Ve08.2h10]